MEERISIIAMDYTKNIKAGLAIFPLKKMSKSEKLLAVSAFVAKGTNDEIKISDINKRGVWSKELFKSVFSYRYYYAAIKSGWLEPVRNKNGYFVVTGYNHLSSLVEEINSKEIRKVGKLTIFDSKATSTFDVYIKKILREAKQRVLIVDSYMSDVLFDDIFREIPKNISARMVYGSIHNIDSFKIKLIRFKKEWLKFDIKENKKIHDRFLIVDNNGYILGPSIKDAADKSPGIIVALGQSETKLLTDFFLELWG